MQYKLSNGKWGTAVVIVDNSGVPVSAGTSTSPITVTTGQVTTITTTIANATSITSDIDFGTARLGRIVMPAAWTAADLTFQTSHDGVMWSNLYDSFGTEYKVVAAASRSILIPLSDMLSVRYLRIRSGTAATPVNQGAARPIVIVLVS